MKATIERTGLAVVQQRTRRREGRARVTHRVDLGHARGNAFLAAIPPDAFLELVASASARRDLAVKRQPASP